MAIAQKITRDNFTTLLKRSSEGRAGTPDGNIYFDTDNDVLELITYDELNQIDLGSGAEDNPFTTADKIQVLALYFFVLQEVEADPTLQGFRVAVDAVSNEMGKLVGATAFLNLITLATNSSTTNLIDHDKVGDSGFTEFAIDGTINKVWHGAKSLVDINSTTQPYYLLAASMSEADRMAATPIDFADLGDINAVILTYTNGGNDYRDDVLIVCARQFGYTIGEADSISTGVNRLGAYSQGYGVGNSIAADIAALNYDDIITTPIAPYSNTTFYRHATAQTQTGFSSFGGGTSGDFTDEVQLSAGTMSIIELRAWFDAQMLQDTDINANTGTTGAFIPKRVEPLYTIDLATSKLVTRTGIYVNPDSLTPAAQQLIIMTDDAGGQHTVPFQSGIAIAVSQSWVDDNASWYRVMYEDAAGTNDFNTEDAITVLDASSVAMSGDATDARLTGLTLNLTYAYDTETAGGNVTAGVDQSVVLQLGGIDNTKTRYVTFDITASTAIAINAETDLETN